jgi:hypothetical protein
MKSTQSNIHFNTRRDYKARWVREAQRHGLKLADWITQTLNAHSAPLDPAMKSKITVPESVRFSDLRLARDSDGMISFDWSPIEAICDASGVDSSLLRDGPEDNVAGLIISWYTEHLARGGDRDLVADDLIEEAIAEERAGQRVSLPPGRA